LQSRVLRHEDVDLIDFEPVTESNGKVVDQQLRTRRGEDGRCPGDYQ
jgi:hypothetical protein